MSDATWYLFEHEDGKRSFTTGEPNDGARTANAYWGPGKWTKRKLFSRAEVIEECARVAEFFNDGAHIAHDMREGIFPKRSEPRDAIAAAIRALALPPSERGTENV